MKRSIKKRIAFTFIGLMVLTLVAIGIVHWFFLGNFYFDKKQETLVESWNKINGAGDGDTEITDEFRRFPKSS